MNSSGGERWVPLDPSIGTVLSKAERFARETGFQENPRLSLLRGVVWHNTVEPILTRLSHSPREFDIVISQLKYPRLVIGGALTNILSFNEDILEEAWQEAESKGKEAVYPRDFMIGFLNLQPNPVDRVIGRLAIDKVVMIEALRTAE